MLATTQDKVKSKQFSQVQAVSELHEEFFFFTFFFKIFFLMWTIFFFKSLFNLLLLNNMYLISFINKNLVLIIFFSPRKFIPASLIYTLPCVLLSGMEFRVYFCLPSLRYFRVTQNKGTYPSI